MSYLLQLFPALGHNAHLFGQMLLSKQPVSEHHLEPLMTAFLVMLVIMLLGLLVRPALKDVGQAVVPETKLSLRTFLEVFVGRFYDIAKDIMGPRRARKYFPLIGTCALFIFFANVLGLVPGLLPPTASLNITLGCALFVFLYYNYQGLKENGFGYIKHLFGPWLGAAYIPINVIIFLVEALSVFVIRPMTLALRLMINMTVDHLVVGTFLGLFALLVPLPAMILGVIVIVVQTLVFCLLSSVYLALSTEHEEHH
ncbi:MAG TPA: F0F1 ATP synthase subunit A [Polyangiaceae bacterium]|nr:F0F1 ATP synthase subunit A [Polyangiaceae bacterium]